MMRPSDDDPDYKVGPGKPPLDRRFVKGRSGNPKGRPRKPRPAGADDLSFTELILAGSKRSLTLTERGEPVTLAAAKAVHQSLLGTAGKGNAHAQLGFLKLALDAESRQQKARSEALCEAYRLKLRFEEARDHWVATGRAEMDMEVHPSDIEINGLTGEVKYFIALTDEERAAREMMLEHLEEGHAVLARAEGAIAETGDDVLLELGRDLALIKIHFANELLPSRLRRAAPPQFKVTAKFAAMYLDRDWKGAEKMRAIMARKLAVG